MFLNSEGEGASIHHLQRAKFSEIYMQLRTCILAFPIRQGRATTMASDPQRGHLVPIVASLSGVHSRVPLSAVSIDTKRAQSSN